ncbi:MAG TPA: hypothetical protein VMW32_07865 [Bacteroidales bacterium]|nr:hypothetical protein [Bacteroidales bacterium]
MILLMSVSCSSKFGVRSDIEDLSQLGGLDVDLDSNDIMDTAFGGTNADSSAWTGYVKVTAGVWAQVPGIIKNELITADPQTVNVPALNHYNGILNNESQATGDTEFDLDALVSGMSFSVYIGTDDDDDVYLDPNASEIIILNGTALTGGFRVKNEGSTNNVGDELFCKVITSGAALKLDCKTAQGIWISAGS